MVLLQRKVARILWSALSIRGPDMNPHAEQLRLLKNPRMVLRTCLDPLNQSRRDRFFW
jgi:hypothetical protein